MTAEIRRSIPAASPDSIEVGVVVTSWNRPKYLARCLATLAASDLCGAAVVLVDDGSDDPDTLRLLEHFQAPTAGAVVKVFRRDREDCGPHAALATGLEVAVDEFDCALLANLDSDTVVRRQWLSRLRTLHDELRPRLGPLILSGFNAHGHKVKSSHAHYRVKHSLGGASLLFDREVYDSLVKPNLTDDGWDWRMAKAARAAEAPLICARPSVVQHIGIHGLWSSPTKGWDFATDYWVDSEVLGWTLKSAQSLCVGALRIVRRL